MPDTTTHALVIEDEPDVLDLLARHISRLGMRVSRASSGGAGLTKALADVPDVVIVDINLPDIDGREVIRRLRADERTSDCSIVVCSVLDRDDLIALGADAILAKPFQRASVAEVFADLSISPEGK
ncbi:response regulator [Pilimelia columellifera]|uniref:Response regulatory domain-containing protein n=1 Tax=Pilimelia columellifera subsp. columellifera TaxID=706583 RepID=A0ABP6AXC1_9ACTN